MGTVTEQRPRPRSHSDSPSGPARGPLCVLLLDLTPALVPTIHSGTLLGILISLVLVLAMPFVLCVTLGKWLVLFELQFPEC